MPVHVEEGFIEFSHTKIDPKTLDEEKTITTLFIGDIDGMFWVEGGVRGMHFGVVRSRNGQPYQIGEVEYYEVMDIWKESRRT